MSPPPGVLLPLNGVVRLTTDRSVDVFGGYLESDDGDRVEADMMVWKPGGVKVVELRPKRLLLPGKKYAVNMVRKLRRPPHQVGEVTTGTGEDRTAPTGAKVKEAFVHAMKGCNSCCSEGVLGEVRVEGVADFGMPVATIAWEIWLGPEKGEPYGWMFEPGVIQFGLHPMSCGPALLPRPKKKITVTARPVDLAGNAGSPIEATLDFTAPGPWRRQ